MNKAYEAITSDLIALIKENDELPWSKPWSSRFPKNPVTGTEYSGYNRMILGWITSAKGYDTPRFVTFKQAKKEDGHVRKGESASKVIYWNVKAKDTKEGEWLSDSERDDLKDRLSKEEFDERVDTVPILRYFSVFNLDQCEGLNDLYPEEGEENEPFEDPEKYENMLINYDGGPDFEEGGNRSYYSISEDTVHLPSRTQFESFGGWFHTLAHEAAHSTGHENRLNRDLTGNMRKESYSREELVAELSAAFISADEGINYSRSNEASYIDGWLNKLEEDEKAIIFASSRAEKVVEFIHENN